MNRVLLAFSPVLLLGPALTCAAPRIMAPLFMLCSLAALITDYSANKQKPKPDLTLLAILGGLVAYGLITWFWNINPDETLGKTGQMALTFGLVPFIAPVIARLGADDLRRIGWMLLGGLTLGLTVYFFEAATNFVIYDFTHPGNMDVPDNKQNKAAVLLCLWLIISAPYFLIKGEKYDKLGFAALIGLTAFATSISRSNTAQILSMALPVLAIIVLVLPARLTMILALMGVITITVAMPFAATTFFKKVDWLRADYLNNSMRSRVEIWNQASSRALEKPIFGWGLDASPKLPNRDEHSILYPNSPPISHMHPHNAPIQIWFELGAIGIAFFCALFVTLYRRLGNKTIPAEKYAAFAGSALFLYTLAIWGIWQTWFMATLCFAGLMIYAGTRYLDNPDSNGTQSLGE